MYEQSIEDGGKSCICFRTYVLVVEERIRVQLANQMFLFVYIAENSVVLPQIWVATLASMATSMQSLGLHSPGMMPCNQALATLSTKPTTSSLAIATHS